MAENTNTDILRTLENQTIIKAEIVKMGDGRIEMRVVHLHLADGSILSLSPRNRNTPESKVMDVKCVLLAGGEVDELNPVNLG